MTAEMMWADVSHTRSLWSYLAPFSRYFCTKVEKLLFCSTYLVWRPISPEPWTLSCCYINSFWYI